MKAIIQRVLKASVFVKNKQISQINQGLLVLLGIGKTDNKDSAKKLVDKIINLRIFDDQDKKMNRSLFDIKGEVLVVSQFTLLADVSRGRRPDFFQAAASLKAASLIKYFVDRMKLTGLVIQEGVFGAYMQVKLVNDGPVTLVLNSEEK